MIRSDFMHSNTFNLLGFIALYDRDRTIKSFAQRNFRSPITIVTYLPRGKVHIEGNIPTLNVSGSDTFNCIVDRQCITARDSDQRLGMRPPRIAAKDEQAHQEAKQDNTFHISNLTAYPLASKREEEILLCT